MSQASSQEGQAAPEDRPAEPPKAGRRLWLKALVGLAVTGGLVLFLFRYVDWKHVLAMGQQANWLLALVFPLYVLLYLFRTVRFILLAPRTPFAVMFCIGAIHNFMIRVLPMRTGELSYGFLVRRAGTSGLGESLLGLFLLRVLDATAVVLIFAATLALDQSTYRGDPTIGLLVALGVASLGAVMAIFFRQLLALGYAILAGILSLLRLTRYRRVASILDRLGTLIRSYSKLALRTILAQAGLTLIVWMINFVIVFVVMRGFSVDISFPQAVLGGTGATVTGFLPVGGIGSFGALEAGWALGFALVGLPPSLAVATGFGFSLLTFVGAGILAAICWVIFNRLVRRPEVPLGS